MGAAAKAVVLLAAVSLSGALPACAPRAVDREGAGEARPEQPIRLRLGGLATGGTEADRVRGAR